MNSKLSQSGILFVMALLIVILAIPLAQTSRLRVQGIIPAGVVDPWRPLE